MAAQFREVELPSLNMEQRRAPGPPGHFLLGNLLEFRRDVLRLVVASAKTYGDVVRCRLGPYVLHLLNHPDHVNHVLRDNAANYDKNTRSSATIRSPGRYVPLGFGSSKYRSTVVERGTALGGAAIFLATTPGLVDLSAKLRMVAAFADCSSAESPA